MKKIGLVVLFFAVLIQTSRAIVAVPHPAVCTNQPAWESTLSFGAALTSGDSESVLTTSDFKTHRLNPTNELTMEIQGSYGENDSVKNNETLHGDAQYNHLFTDRTYCYGRADGLHDGIADVAYRATISPGAGYYFVKSKETTFAGELGPGGVFERVDGSVENYAAPRLAERFEHKVDGHLHFWENMEFLPQVDESRNFLVNTEVGVETPLTKRISLRTVLDDNFANVPAPGHTDNNMQLISGLSYKF